MLSATEGWIVGSGGAILRWDGGAWNAVYSPTTTALRDVSMVTPNDGWAVGGEDAGRVIVRWDGSAWSTVLDDPNSPGLETIAMTSVSDGWAAGQDGTLLHWDAIQWTPAPNPVDATLHALAITSSASGWAVGDRGVILWYAGGGESLKRYLPLVRR